MTFERASARVRAANLDEDVRASTATVIVGVDITGEHLAQINVPKRNVEQ